MRTWKSCYHRDRLQIGEPILEYFEKAKLLLYWATLPELLKLLLLLIDNLTADFWVGGVQLGAMKAFTYCFMQITGSQEPASTKATVIEGKRLSKSTHSTQRRWILLFAILMLVSMLCSVLCMYLVIQVCKFIMLIGGVQCSHRFYLGTDAEKTLYMSIQ